MKEHAPFMVAVGPFIICSCLLYVSSVPSTGRPSDPGNAQVRASEKSPQKVISDEASPGDRGRALQPLSGLRTTGDTRRTLNGRADAGTAEREKRGSQRLPLEACRSLVRTL